VTITATTNAGYTWLGWYDGEDKVSIDSELTYTFTMPANNKSYEASWQAYEGTIIYNANGGSGTMTNDNIITGETLAPNTFAKRSGFAFIGWALTVEGDVTYSDKAIFIIFEDGASNTLYAQ